MINESESLIESLRLTPHPEGGYFRETFRSSQSVNTADGVRSSSTAIYYLLQAGDYSGWHRVRSDEAWHHYQGHPLHLHLLDEEGYRLVVLGPDVLRGEKPQFVVPANCWQAAEVPGSGYALCGCTVAPGFDFEDFEMASFDALLPLFPNRSHEDTIRRLIRIPKPEGVLHESR